MIKGPGRDLDMGDSVRWVFTSVTLLVGLLVPFITTCLIVSVVWLLINWESYKYWFMFTCLQRSLVLVSYVS